MFFNLLKRVWTTGNEAKDILTIHPIIQGRDKDQKLFKEATAAEM